MNRDPCQRQLDGISHSFGAWSNLGQELLRHPHAGSTTMHTPLSVCLNSACTDALTQGSKILVVDCIRFVYSCRAAVPLTAIRSPKLTPTKPREARFTPRSVQRCPASTSWMPSQNCSIPLLSLGPFKGVEISLVSHSMPVEYCRVKSVAKSMSEAPSSTYFTRRARPRSRGNSRAPPHMSMFFPTKT